MFVSHRNAVLVVVTAVSVVTILLQVPAISHQKAVESDAQKSKDVSTLHYQIDSYTYKEGKLPASLKSLSSLSTELEKRISDYTYEKTSVGFDEGYKLCATFKTAQGLDDEGNSYESSYSSSYVDSYEHAKGNVCFSYKKPYTSSRTTSNSYSTSTTSSVNSLKDATRQKNLETIRLELTNYYAVNKKYPTLAEINDKTWRTTNMQYLLDSSLKDPDATGTVARLAAKTTRGVYAYEPVGQNKAICDNIAVDCTSLTLSATLSTGVTTKLFK